MKKPKGVLETEAVRHVGNASELGKFKWSEHTGRYRQAEKASYSSDTYELRDVPAEYMPPGNPS